MELIKKDAAKAVPFSALPEAERKVLQSIRTRGLEAAAPLDVPVAE